MVIVMVDYDKAYNLVDDVIVKGSIENYFSTKQTMASCHSFSPNKRLNQTVHSSSPPDF